MSPEKLRIEGFGLVIASLRSDNEGRGHAERALTACCCWFVFQRLLVASIMLLFKE